VGKDQFETRLRNRAGEFIRALKSVDIEGSIVEDSIREFAIKIFLSMNGQDLGTAVLYYSPKSGSFSIKTHELRDKTIAPMLEHCWEDNPAVRPSSVVRYEVYVDGSHIDGATGYGAVVLKNGKVVDELSGPVDVSDVGGTRQVAGELVAVKEALNWCLSHSVKEVSIYFDYLGIEKWATGQWKANQSLTKEYARFVTSCPIKIRWHKVDSHTGDRWNDRADTLAKQGARSIQASVQVPGTGPARSGTGDLVSELIEKTDAWIEFLMMRGIEASFDRIYNEQFSRIYIVQQENRVGTFDLYNTKKKRFSPYLHDFHNEELKERIETLWREFR
jgi:ribonuclease HI